MGFFYPIQYFLGKEVPPGIESNFNLFHLYWYFLREVESCQKEITVTKSFFPHQILFSRKLNLVRYSLSLQLNIFRELDFSFFVMYFLLLFFFSGVVIGAFIGLTQILALAVKKPRSRVSLESIYVLNKAQHIFHVGLGSRI